MRPNRPIILPKTSTMRIFTNKSGSAASARAAVEPATPTEIPQRRLHAPTVRPPQNSAYPASTVEPDNAFRSSVRTCEVVLARIQQGIRDCRNTSRVDYANDLRVT